MFLRKAAVAWKPASSIPKARIGRPFGRLSAITSRAFSSSPVVWAGAQTFERLTKKHPNWQTQTVSVAQLLEDFRNIQGLEVVIGKEATNASIEYRDAERTLYALSVSDVGDHVTLADVAAVLPNDNGRAWTAIFSRIFCGIPSRLAKYNEELNAAGIFARIYNIGGVQAKKFAAAGARTIQDLKDMHQSGKIKLQKAQLLGIDHFNDIEKLIPREEIDLFIPKLQAAITDADPRMKIEVLGSYRRGNKFSSDMDIVATHPDIGPDTPQKEVKPWLTKLIEAATQHKLIVDSLADGEVIYRGLARLQHDKPVRRIDFTMARYDAFVYRTLGLTGDDRLMKIMRKRAKDRGLFLNTEGMGPRIMGKTAEIWDPEQPILVETEEDIFKELGLDYLPPDQRHYKLYKDKLDHILNT